MSQGFYFDMTRCSGCSTCQAACKDRLDLEMVGPLPRRVKRYEVGIFPKVTGYSTSISCNHCETPACVASCPTGALFKADDGIVLIDDSLCITCKTCLTACPYGAPQFVESLNLVLKCDSCKALRDAGMNPVCADACPSRALDFGDMEELGAKYATDLVQEVAVLPTADITNPNLVIKARVQASEAGFMEVTF